MQSLYTSTSLFWSVLSRSVATMNCFTVEKLEYGGSLVILSSFLSSEGESLNKMIQNWTQREFLMGQLAETKADKKCLGWNSR